MRQAELEMAMEDAEERAAVQRGRAKASGAPARGESSPPSTNCSVAKSSVSNAASVGRSVPAGR
eukprot:30738-Pelagococcus_subviridis.AAC.3